MTFVDANLLLRFLAKQPPEQAEIARRVLSRGQRGVELRLEPLTVAEVVYVLGGVYGYSVERIKQELLALLATGALVVEHEGAVLDALTKMTPKLDFPDVYLAARARSVGAKVASFDKGFKKLEVALLPLESDAEGN